MENDKKGFFVSLRMTKRTMKIVLVNKFWYPRGGAEVVALLTKQLLEKAGHEVVVFGMKHPENIFTNEYFTDFIDYNNLSFVKKIGSAARSIYNRQAKNNFGKLLDEFKPDLVHFHNIYHQLTCSIISAAKERKIKTVMTLHDYKFISPNYNLYHHDKIAEECTGEKYYRCLFNNCMENCGESLVATLESYFVDLMGYKRMIDKYISPSNFLRDKFIENGFEKNNISVLRNPIDDSFFQNSYQDGKYILYIGRLSSEKGVKYLLEAAGNFSDVQFKIVGDGPERKKLEQYVIQNNLSNVEFTGIKTGKELDGLLDNSRIVVLPSVWYENASLSILEAKARGKIVLASNIGGISEMLPAELLFTPANSQDLIKKIEKWYYSDSITREKMGKILSDEVKNEHSGNVYLKKLEEIYSELK